MSQRLRFVAVFVVVGLLSIATHASAQSLLLPPDLEREPPTVAATNGEAVNGALPEPLQSPAPDDRPCDGCPPRSVGKSLFQVTMINVFYGLANLIRGQVTAEITPETWWTNMKRGWEWDLDDFTVNQIGHPYQGNNYFTSGRANGLNFWESAAVTAFGSGTWEYFGETNQASLNDFINTTLGGIALGEMFHRTAWLVRDTRASGRGRLWREIGATAIDPVTGYNRFRSGDASRVTETPREFVPSSLGAIGMVGASFRGSSSELVTTTDPFAEIEMRYGDWQSGRSERPYDAFGVRLTFGAGSAFSEAQVRGRLFGRPVANDSAQVTVLQGYQYNKNEAYQFGAQSIDSTIAITRKLNDRMSISATALGGVTVLGAVDSIPPEAEVVVVEEETAEDDPGQGVSTGPRFYDYGPGFNVGGFVNLRWNQRPILLGSYELHHLTVLDGFSANHWLQQARAQLLLPIRGRLGFGATAEFFERRTNYKASGFTDVKLNFPQFRIALVWSTS